MTETCPRCGDPYVAGLRHEVDGIACSMMRAAYQRGIRREVEIAQRELVTSVFLSGSYEHDWSDVDRAVEEECK